MMDDQEIDEHIVRAFLNSLREKSDTSDPWASSTYGYLCQFFPQRAWVVVCQLIEQASFNHAHEIGLGELESFLSQHATEYIDRIEQQALTSPKFFVALSDVWLTKGTVSSSIEVRLRHASHNKIYFIEVEPELDGFGE